MNSFIKRFMTAALSVMLVFSLVFISTASGVSADTVPFTFVEYNKNVTVYIYADAGEFEHDYIISLGKRVNNAKKVTITSSKKGIITEPDYFLDGIYFQPKKAGTTVLTIKIKKKNGTKKKYKVNLTVKKYESPFKTLKIGKKDYVKKLGNKRYLKFKLAGKSAKVSIKPKKGWKVSKITYHRRYVGDGDGLEDTEKYYKNNKVIKFKNNKDYQEFISFTMTEKATGVEVKYNMDLKK